MNKRHRPLLLAGQVPLAMLAGCLPAPGVHEVLQISADGQYQLDGRSVAREQLRQVLAQEQQRVKTLLIELHPSPEAGMEAVNFSIQAVKSAHARLAFTRG